MIKDNILPADSFVVYNKTILTDYDYKILIMLYQPIIGQLAISLYLTLRNCLDKNENLSSEFSHHHLMTIMRSDLKIIKESRTKLEAIGLLKTFYKKGNINNYVYELYSPVIPYEFFNNPLLNISLHNNLGSTEYEKIKKYFKIPYFDLKDYENISSSFNDVFEVTDISNFDTLIQDFKQNNTNKLKVSSKIDIENIFILIPNDLFNIKNLTKDTKELIEKLAFLYGFDEERISGLIINSLNDKKLIDKEKLKTNFRNFYKFENSGKLPNIIYRVQPEALIKKNKDNTKKSKIIHQFETISPYEFLFNKYNNSKPSKSDLIILEFLLVDMALKPGVVNVLIDYVLKINNNKLTKNFIEAIAGQWSRSKVETVEDAMSLAEREYKSKQNYKLKKVVTKIEKKPEWFDKNITENKASHEEIKEMEEMLKEFR